MKHILFVGENTAKYTDDMKLHQEAIWNKNQTMTSRQEPVLQD